MSRERGDRCSESREDREKRCLRCEQSVVSSDDRSVRGYECGEIGDEYVGASE
jgi:hypothetical protein